MADTLFRPGSVIPGVGEVRENANRMPWPADRHGALYMGAAMVGHDLYDASSGARLTPEEVEQRRNNLVYNYGEVYKPDIAVGLAYRTAFVRAVLNTAMDLWGLEYNRGEMPSQLQWDRLPVAERERYLDRAYRKIGVGLELFPPSEIEFLQHLVDPPRPVTQGELAERRLGRIHQNQEKKHGDDAG